MRISFLGFAFILTSCFGLFDSGSSTIYGNYEVMWIDLHEQQFICESSESQSSGCIVLVSEYVFSVGHNDNFIIAKQHPTSGFENGFKIDTTVTNYFIIEINKSSNKVIGPLTQAKFTAIRKELKIENIKFDMNYPEVP
jgi:hypothetical protein